MEQGSVEPVDGRHPGRDPLATAVGFAALELLRQIAAARRAVSVPVVRDHVHLAADAPTSRFLRVRGALAPQLLFVFVVLRDRRGAVLPANVRHAEYRLPALKGWYAVLRGGEAETGGDEGPFGPAVVDAGEMPVHRVWGGVAVELVADVNEMLD